VCLVCVLVLQTYAVGMGTASLLRCDRVIQVLHAAGSVLSAGWLLVQLRCLDSVSMCAPCCRHLPSVLITRFVVLEDQGSL
jgi:hypothetical protein